jgi:hypothetical protein
MLRGVNLWPYNCDRQASSTTIRLIILQFSCGRTEGRHSFPVTVTQYVTCQSVTVKSNTPPFGFWELIVSSSSNRYNEIVLLCYKIQSKPGSAFGVESRVRPKGHGSIPCRGIGFFLFFIVSAAHANFTPTLECSLLGRKTVGVYGCTHVHRNTGGMPSIPDTAFMALLLIKYRAYLTLHFII